MRPIVTCGDNIVMRGDNMSAVHGMNQSRGGKGTWSGELMRVLGCLEMASEWNFDAVHVKGIGNDLADGISR